MPHVHNTKHDQGTASQFAEAVTPAVERTANRLVEATQMGEVVAAGLRLTIFGQFTSK